MGAVLTDWVTPLLVACLVLAAWMLVVAARNRIASRLEYTALGLVEAAFVAYAFVGVVRLATEAPGEWLTVAAYLLGLVLVLPFGALWGMSDRSRWSAVVLAIAFVTAAVLLLRLDRLWTELGLA